MHMERDSLEIDHFNIENLQVYAIEFHKIIISENHIFCPMPQDTGTYKVRNNFNEMDKSLKNL